MSNSNIAPTVQVVLEGESPKRQEDTGEKLGVKRNVIVREITLELLGSDETTHPSQEMILILYEAICTPPGVILWLSNKFFEHSKVNHNPSKTYKLPSPRIVLENFVNILFDAVQTPNETGYPEPTYSEMVQVVRLLITIVFQEEDVEILRFPTLVVEQIMKIIHSSVKKRILHSVRISGETYDLEKLSSNKIKEEFQKVSSEVNLGERSNLFIERINSTPLDERFNSHAETFTNKVCRLIEPFNDGEYPKLPLRVTEQLKKALNVLNRWVVLPVVSVSSVKKSKKEYHILPGNKIPANLKNLNDPVVRAGNFVEKTNEYFFIKTKWFPGIKKEVRLSSREYVDMDPIKFNPINMRKAPYLPKEGDLVCFLLDENSKKGPSGEWFYCSPELLRMKSLLSLDKKGNFNHKGHDFLNWHDVRINGNLGTNGFRKMQIARDWAKLPKLTMEEKKALYFFLKVEMPAIAHCNWYLATVELFRFGMLPNRNSCPLDKDGVLASCEPDIPIKMYRLFLEEWTDYDPVKDHGFGWDQVLEGISFKHHQYLIDEMKVKIQEELEGKMKGIKRREKKNYEMKLGDSNFPCLLSNSIPSVKKRQKFVASEWNPSGKNDNGGNEDYKLQSKIYVKDYNE